MIQITLDRLMEGIAAALRESVIPELSDSYARSQAEAAANLIANLATRVQWRPDMLQAELGRLEPILAHAARIAPRHLLDPGALAPAAETDAGALVARRTAALRELASVQTWLAGAAPADDPELALLAQEVRAFLDWQLDDQVARLRT
jgi:hypothetical protein